MVAAALVTAAVAAPTTEAAEATLLKTFGSWAVYRAIDDGVVVCFAATAPVRRLPEGLRRGDAFLMVSDRPGHGVRGEVSLLLGYPLDQTAVSRLTVEERSFALMEKGEMAWPEQIDEQDDLVAAFVRGLDATVEARSARGNTVREEFSLKGFTRAYQTVTSDCK